MPHAALWVVQHDRFKRFINKMRFQCRTRLCGWCNRDHHATAEYLNQCFNAARGFVGGATQSDSESRGSLQCFNAARGFVGGAALRH